MCFPGPSCKGWRGEGCAGFPNDGYCRGGFPYTGMADGAKVTFSEADVTNASKQIIAGNFARQESPLPPQWPLWLVPDVE